MSTKTIIPARVSLCSCQFREGEHQESDSMQTFVHEYFMESLIQLTNSLQQAPGCWCGSAKDNPLTTEHSEVCTKIRLYFLEQKGENDVAH